MKRAAGILFATKDYKVLLMRRSGRASQDADCLGCWAFPGGGIEGEETAEECARREFSEEAGMTHDGPLMTWTRRIQPVVAGEGAEPVDFTTFLARSDEFAPTLNDEHDAYQWVERRFALSSPLLHPGVRIALQRFDMDELSIAKAIQAQELTSPQRYGNLLLIAMRITGTGRAYRQSIDEYVWRDPSIYLNDEFLERCMGLPVIMEHPKAKMLDTNEFRDRIVGMITVPYIRDNEVWGVAKILDMEAADMLETEKMSTSPAVVFVNAEASGVKMPMKDGATLLIEGKPSLLDHVALTPLGVWDKGGPPTGVESIDAEPPVTKLDSAVELITQAKLDKICRLAAGVE